MTYSKSSSLRTAQKFTKLRTFIHIIDVINEQAGHIISYLLLPLIGVVVAEVVLRSVFNRPTIWSFEISTFIWGSIAVLAGGYVLFQGRHVKVDVLYNRFSLRTRAILDLVTSFFFFFFCGILLWKSAVYVWDAILSQEKNYSLWGPVLWPVKSTIFIGALLIILQGIAQFIRTLYTAITGESGHGL
jgi:TRAP-type mannitol/chloroaromatic compound transport system permease small subunit